MSLCSIANDIRIDLEYDLTDSLEPAKILDILNTVGCSIYTEADFHGKTDRQHNMMIKAMHFGLRSQHLWMCFVDKKTD